MSPGLAAASFKALTEAAASSVSFFIRACASPSPNAPASNSFTMPLVPSARFFCTSPICFTRPSADDRSGLAALIEFSASAKPLALTAAFASEEPAASAAEPVAEIARDALSAAATIALNSSDIGRSTWPGSPTMAWIRSSMPLNEPASCCSKSAIWALTRSSSSFRRPGMPIERA